MIIRLSQLGKVKLGIHTVTALLTFITACIAIAMDVKQGSAGGAGVFFNILVSSPINYTTISYATSC
jgi:hypothetical protein